MKIQALFANGFTVYTKDGKDISPAEFQRKRANGDVVSGYHERINGPHHDAKWMRNYGGEPLSVDFKRTEILVAGELLNGKGFGWVPKSRIHFKGNI